MGHHHHHGQADHLQARHTNAGEEHQQRERQHIVLIEFLDTGQNGTRLAMAEPGDRQHRQQIGRHVENGRRDEEGDRPLQAVRLALVHGLATARAGKAVMRVGAGLHDQLASATGNQPAAGRRLVRGGLQAGSVGTPLDTDLVPDRGHVEGAVGGDHQHHDRGEREDRGVEIDMRQVHQLGVGDEDAEHVDLDHRPGPEALLQPEQARQITRARLPSRAGQNQQIEPDHHTWHQHGREQHDSAHEGEGARCTPESHRPGQDVDRVQPSEQVERHQGHAEHDQVKHQRRHAARQRETGRIGPVTTQPARAANATDGVARRAFGGSLEQSAIRAFPHFRRDPHLRMRLRDPAFGRRCGHVDARSPRPYPCHMRPSPSPVNGTPRLRPGACPCKTAPAVPT